MQPIRPDAATPVIPGAIGRRDALALLGGLAGVLAAGSAAGQGAIDRAGFLRASSLVTGVPEDELTDLADPLLALFRDQSPALMQLLAAGRGGPPGDIAVAVRGTKLEALCRQLAAAWYTGTDGKTVLSYDDALAWKVAGFATAPGACGGAFGAWAEPPPPP
jgi:hypothetical protein